MWGRGGSGWQLALMYGHSHGRHCCYTTLYKAAFMGHVKVVAALVAPGGIDVLGKATTDNGDITTIT